MIKKKILVLISNLEIGGAQNMAFQLARELNEFEICFVVLSSRQGNWLEKNIEDRFNTIFLGFKGKQTIFKVLKTFRAINSFKPDIVHCHMGTLGIGYLWCSLHHKKLIVTCHANPAKAFSKRNKRYLDKGLKKEKLNLVAVSYHNYKMCLEYFGHSENICFINNGLDVTKYYKKSHEIFTFLHVGRQDKNKNATFILECFKSILEKGYHAKLLMLGDGPIRGEIIKKINDLKINEYVSLCGNVNNTEDYYAISDCFLLASNSEALPMTAIEALATQIPIISTDVGGMRDVVKENGFLVDKGDKEAFIKSMEKVLRKEIDEENVKRNSNKLVEMFSSKKMANEYKALYLK